MGHGLFDDENESELSDVPPSPPSSPPKRPSPAPAPRRKSAPSSTTRPTLPRKRTYQQRKRPTYPQVGSASSISEETPATESEADEPPRKVPARRKRGAPVSKPATPAALKRGRHRASTLTENPPPVAATPKASENVEPRLPSFLSKSFPVAKNLAPISNTAPRADIWSYLELAGLTWVRMDTGAGKIASVDQTEGNLCWWPGEVTLKTTTTLNITLCGSPPGDSSTLKLAPSSINESNILTFRRPNSSSVRFPSFKLAYVSSAGSSSQDTTLEELWKVASARAFKIDTESNDGLEDICLLFSQQTRSSRDDSTQVSADHAHDTEEEGNRTDEDDVLENDTAVLCRYRTRYYPAKVTCYFPRDAKRPKGRYKCTFADDSFRIAPRHEVHTQFDPGFASCALGSYSEHKPDKMSYSEARTGRAPTPEPRASSPGPEPGPTIDTAEYCARERMRDQLRPVLPFLQGIISRTYLPAQSGSDVLDRHAAFMQGGRARKNLAFSVHTGDLNEDDCEELMHEVSRWALRGERWASTKVEANAVESMGSAVPNESTESVESTELNGPAESREPTDSKELTGSIETPETTESVMLTESVQPAEPTDSDSDARVVEGDVEMEDASSSNDVDAKVPTTDEGAVDEQMPLGNELAPTVEDEGDKTITAEDGSTTTHMTEFHRLVQLQPPRPTGASDYEQLAPGDRMGYVSDVLYPEAAAIVLSFRRGIRIHPCPVEDAEAEFRLYQAGLQEAKNTASKEDWVDQLLATRQLRELGARRGILDEEEQVVVPGGTRSRPKYMLSKTGSIFK
ncbi:hypothetical protein BDV93DRAFT_605403 [Ceratobasidium sp. AG-I]|nr:hypothetical protein BDV93DRAFT_605403 [Ceratobasidium sp. AG-I]